MAHKAQRVAVGHKVLAAGAKGGLQLHQAVVVVLAQALDQLLRQCLLWGAGLLLQTKQRNARQHGGQQRARLGRREQKGDAGRRLFQQLEQRVLRLHRHEVGALDDKDPAKAPQGREHGGIAQGTNLIDLDKGAVGRRHREVGVGACVKAGADAADAAGACSLRIGAQQALCNKKGRVVQRLRLRALQQYGVGQPARLQQTAQRLGQRHCPASFLGSSM